MRPRAKQDDDEARVHPGWTYADGEGVAMDYYAAFASVVRIAAAQDDNLATVNRDELIDRGRPPLG